jgi:pimeloyl-ACP methyl ester carboxylesterase
LYRSERPHNRATDEIAAAQEWNLDAGQASRISVRTSIVTDGDSATVTSVYDETAAILVGMMPTARHIVLPGVRHGMPLQDPAGVARLVADAVSA